MKNKKELQDQINSIISNNPVDPNVAKLTKNKFFRDVRFYENELTHNNVLLPFEVCLAEIEADSASSPVGVHGHTREIYVLRWEKLEDEKFYFTLENTLAKKKRKLIDCPEEVVRDIYHLLPKIVQSMASSAQKLLDPED